MEVTLPIDNQVVETMLHNGITIYSNNDTRQQLAEVALAYPKLWKDSTRTVNIPENQYLIILLKINSKVNTAKIYLLRPKDQALVD